MSTSVTKRGGCSRPERMVDFELLVTFFHSFRFSGRRSEFCSRFLYSHSPYIFPTVLNISCPGSVSLGFRRNFFYQKLRTAYSYQILAQKKFRIIIKCTCFLIVAYKPLERTLTGSLTTKSGVRMQSSSCSVSHGWSSRCQGISHLVAAFRAIQELKCDRKGCNHS